MRGIQRALDFGVEMIEIDVRPCGDGTLVVVHDGDLARVAGSPVRVRDLAVGQLSQFDVGKGERIPTLEEALALIRGRAMVNLDQKADGLAEQLLAAIDRGGRRSETMLSGNAPSTFAEIRARVPEIEIAWSIDARRRDLPLILAARRSRAAARGLAGRLIAIGRASHMPAVTLEWRLASAAVVAYCKRAGFRVLTWTVDDLATMQRLRAAGVDGITSNRPDRLAQLL